MTHDELEKMVLSHEKALIIVADTERKALEGFRLASSLAIMGIGLAMASILMSMGVFA